MKTGSKQKGVAPKDVHPKLIAKKAGKLFKAEGGKVEDEEEGCAKKGGGPVGGAATRAHGGRAARKAGGAVGKATGGVAAKKAGGALARASGGGCESNPFSSAHGRTAAPGRKLQHGNAE